MPKRLVVCCDGTWNTPDQLRDGRRAPTNVTKVALNVAPKDFSGQDQRTFYHRGVGTNRRERIRGGAFGFGLSRDVRGTYRFLVQAFEPGDELFFFGFSRGTFTARSTVGFVRTAASCGASTPDGSTRRMRSTAAGTAAPAHGASRHSCSGAHTPTKPGSVSSASGTPWAVSASRSTG